MAMAKQQQSPKASPELGSENQASEPSLEDLKDQLKLALNTIDELKGQIEDLSEGDGSDDLAEQVNKATLAGKHDGYFVIKEKEMNALLAALILRRAESFMGVSLITWAQKAFSLDTHAEAQDLIQHAKNTHMAG
jgi:hypothetical protein